MRRGSLMIAAVCFLGSILASCGTFGKPVENLRIVEGQIDNIIIAEVAEKKDFLSVTHLGFTNGQGISLVGVQPGFSKGKTVKLKLKFYMVLRGTPYYEVLEVITGASSATEQPASPETSPKQ